MGRACVMQISLVPFVKLIFDVRATAVGMDDACVHSATAQGGGAPGIAVLHHLAVLMTTTASTETALPEHACASEDGRVSIATFRFRGCAAETQTATTEHVMTLASVCVTGRGQETFANATWPILSHSKMAVMTFLIHTTLTRLHRWTRSLMTLN